MKVVIPLPSLVICGGHKVISDAAHALTLARHEVEIIIPDAGEICLPPPAPVKRVAELTRDTIPYGDIVLSSYYTTCGPAFEAWPHQVVNFSQGFEPLLIKDPAVFEQYRHDVPIISTSRWLDEQIFKLTGRRTTVVNPGVNSTHFFPRRKRTFDSHEGGVKKVMYVAHASSAFYKGLDEFVESVRIVSRKMGGKLVVLFTSQDENIDYPSDVAHETYAPRSDGDMARLYNEADLYVSTSWYEGFSLPPLEAMACGTPVVTTDSGGVNDYCRHGHNSLIVETKNPHSIAAGMLTLLNDADTAQALSRHGVETARSFSTEGFGRKFVGVLEAIHAERSRTVKRKGLGANR